MDLTELSAPPSNINIHINHGYSSIHPFMARHLKTASYTLALEDESSLVDMDVAVPNTVTIPNYVDVPLVVGTVIDIAQYGVGKTTIAPALGVGIRSASVNRSIASQYSSVRLVKIADNEWYLFGTLIP